jgi:uroporphyrinogen-III decarboxylase
VIDAVHEGGSHVWVHCHGRMGPVLERFADMGVDVLNPLEPPPMGDVTLRESFDRLDGRMGIEGNIETHDIMRMEPEKFRRLVAETVEAGRGERFILCPSSGYMENPQPTDRQIQNLLTFVHYGVECAQR